MPIYVTKPLIINNVAGNLRDGIHQKYYLVKNAKAK